MTEAEARILDSIQTGDISGQIASDILALLADRDEREAALLAELERERMRLCACGVVAMSNTAESAARNRDMHADYRSASCDDVARAVDREMALRAEVEALRAALRECDAVARERGDKYGLCDCIDNGGSPYPSQWLADLLALAKDAEAR